MSILFERAFKMNEMGWLMLGFFILVTMIFVAIAFFLPEWVGITGKKAHEIMREQQQDPATTPEADSKPPGNPL